ncbi:hypothetical protein CY34DRAFT_806893 [Suillus luteus UH-Slu-Lm8-n1]|uniref:Uncharacterized protein n=1 Tax=Suillus luteus UH-Slu-Lm8-n1 TaxID=930992 RepID=A0A0D0BAV8_9AGAM|nr:hypothetical protein CY34DRAFT_806893 [Suillus luteus UH-Slu-Lm8-n1]
MGGASTTVGENKHCVIPRSIQTKKRLYARLSAPHLQHPRVSGALSPALGNS